MATIILHAGTSKAGSSTVQTWVRKNLAFVRDTLGVELVVFRGGQGGSAGGLRVHEDGPVNSGSFVSGYFGMARDPSVVKRFTEELDRHARDHETILVSGEAFALLFAELDRTFLAGLERLATEHTVRIAYYVRAQHESLEAAWRQWGFRSDRGPSDYVRFRQRFLAYLETLEGVAALAPHVSFEVRRFPPSAADGDSVVDDFARTFLGAPTSVDHGHMRANTGLPLEVVNALRHAPAGWFWDSPHDNRALKRIKQIVAGSTVDEAERSRRSRALLQRYCFDRFEPGNIVLAQKLSWTDEHFVPPPSDDDHGRTPIDLGLLDELWDDPRPREELQPWFVALREAIEPESEDPTAEALASRATAKAFVREFFGAQT